MPAANSYSNVFSAEKAFDVTLSDTATQPYHRALWVGSGGDLRVQMRGENGQGGNTVTFKNIAAGSSLGIRCKLIYTTGTTASDVVGIL